MEDYYLDELPVLFSEYAMLMNPRHTEGEAAEGTGIGRFLEGL